MTRYRVTRTSIWDDEVPPCEGAYKLDYLRADRRTLKSEEEYDAKLGLPGKQWRDKGQGHSTWERGIVRYFPGKTWFVDAEDLSEFVKEHGAIVLSSADDAEELALLSIEIYDGCRE